MNQPLTILCIASYFKGDMFLRTLKKLGCKVLLLTAKNLEHKPWSHDCIDEIFYGDVTGDSWNMENVTRGLAYVLRSHKVDRIVALDDYDVERGAHLREHFRIAGMGQTTARYFRDKLAMRLKAREAGLNVPDFSALFFDLDINNFIARSKVDSWLVKPRSQASAMGIKKVHNGQELWEVVHKLGEERDGFLVEEFLPGEVYHVDSLNFEEKVVFARTHRYLNPPMEVAHEGGIFRSINVDYQSEEDRHLQAENEKVMRAFGMKHSASHTEFIKARQDGKFYFLETSSRVGGAHISDMIEVSAGINIWAEWAKIEVADALGEKYKLPKINKHHTGLIVSLTRQAEPDISPFSDPEIAWRMAGHDHHLGFIVKTQTQKHALEILEKYTSMIRENYHAAQPSNDKPTN